MIAVDVGYGLLDYRLRKDPRVLVMERTNARELTPRALPALAVGAIRGCPISRPSTCPSSRSTKVLPAVIGCLRGRYDVLALVKPQFELGRGRVPRGGVVRDRAPCGARRCWRWGASRSRSASRCAAITPPACPDPKGNRETFIWLTDPAAGRGSAATPASLEAMAREVEP